MSTYPPTSSVSRSNNFTGQVEELITSNEASNYDWWAWREGDESVWLQDLGIFCLAGKTKELGIWMDFRIDCNGFWDWLQWILRLISHATLIPWLSYTNTWWCHHPTPNTPPPASFLENSIGHFLWDVEEVEPKSTLLNPSSSYLSRWIQKKSLIWTLKFKGIPVHSIYLLWVTSLNYHSPKLKKIIPL